MNDSNQNHHTHEESDSNSAHTMRHPYWKRAHRDWRIWAAVVIMIGGMIIYVMTDDFSMRFRSRPPVTLGK
jgi:hypothetical protein